MDLPAEVCEGLREVLPEQKRMVESGKDVSRRVKELKKQVRQHMETHGLSELPLPGVGTFTLTESDRVASSTKAVKAYLSEAQYKDFAAKNTKRVKKFKLSR